MAMVSIWRLSYRGTVMRDSPSKGSFVLPSVFGCVLLVGCGGGLQVSHVLTGPPLPPKSDDAALPVYFDAGPGAPYREVGQIRIRSAGDDATLDQVVEAAVHDAREIGADAIIVDARRHYESEQVWFDCAGHPHVDPGARLNARVTAIQFVPEGTVQPETPPQGPAPVRRCP
jgi:hypothetical protein